MKTSGPTGRAEPVAGPQSSDTASDYLVVDHLDRRFASQGNLAIRDVSFRVQQGDFTSLVGPSGCGKSTLLHMLAGLSQPSAGAVYLKGERITGPRRDMVYVFQQYSKSIYPWKTVLDNILLGVKYRSSEPRKALEKLCREQLELVGLGAYAHFYPYQLSGGMQQRVAIARALVCRPDLLLMDEPFSALDAMTRVELQDLLLRLWRDFRLTVLFVTHDLEEALYLSQRVIVLSRSPGTVIETVEVPLDYPRDQIATRSHPLYLELRERLYRHMVDQVAAGRSKSS